MKLIQLIVITFITLISSACSSAKKSTTSTAVMLETNSQPISPTPLVFVSTTNGIYAPGKEELLAIQIRYKDVTLEKLQEGHQLYTKGACINCHTASNIYNYDETQWKIIIDDMAAKAYLSETQKDAVYKYVLAIKAKQPK